MKKKLARLVVIFVALATCLILVTPTAGTTQPSEKATEPTVTETIIIEETVIIETEPPIIDFEILPTEIIAEEVVVGKWGATMEREENLESVGYDAEEIEEYIETTPIEIDAEYPEATYIWNVLRSWGWSPETCAGIIGNMMAEVGGGTLDLSNWDANGGSGYGLIQWLNARRRLIKSRYGEYPTIDEQLEYMRDEMMGTNNTPWQFSNTAQYNKVMYGETPEECAYAFACYFERCGESHRWIRRSYARTAYEYFMN